MPDNLELSRTRAELKALGADFALSTSGENVTYVSHYEVPVDFGPAAAQRYVPPMAFFDVNGSGSSLIVSDSYAAGAKQNSALDEVHVHECFLLDRPVSPRENFL